jgi:uncharacterized protein (TIGR02996 family)
VSAIEVARKALRDGDEIAALDALLSAWRDTRAPELGAAITALGERLEEHLPEITGKRAELHERWLAVARARRAADWPQLLKTSILTANRFGVAEVKALMARGKALADWPADPRTAAIVIEMVRRPGYEASSRSAQPFWAGLLDLMVAHGDARDGETLAKLDVSRGFRSYSDRRQAAEWFGEQVARSVERLAAKPPRKVAHSFATAGRDLAKAIGKRGALGAEQIAKLARTPVVIEAPAPRAPRKAAPAGSPVAALQAAERALDDDAAALAALLDAWRTARAPEIAELIELVSQRTALPAIDGKDRKAIHATWLATAKQRRDVDVPRLLASITHTLGRSTDASERVAALDKWPSDPRVTTGVVRQLEHPPFYTSSTKSFWAALIALAVDHGDPRAIAAFGALRERFPAILVQQYTDTTPMVRWFQRELDSAIGKLRPAPPLDRESAAIVARVAGKLRAANEQRDELFAQIAEHPDDDALKHVLADLLQQRGDPRGELIALQLANREAERVKTLIAQHRDTWLGPLAPIAGEVAFEKGFLASIQLHAKPDEIAPLVGHPIWATVKKLSLGQVSELPRDLLHHPVMRTVEYLGGLDAARLRELLAGPPVPYRAINVMLFDPDELHMLTNKRAAEVLPKLRVLELLAPEDDLAALRRSPLGKRLEQIIRET